ncbi:MAG: hypothetical protein RBU37_18600, partial [Myxococcota bacterium]|nr:hypothetical protein [Myxococcota bacterium]
MNTPASRDASRLRWAYVAFFGALWGGVEITIGAFLHTVRIPFAGLFLASFSASLMVAQRQLCPQRGTTLATGVVAALLKSLSPGGIILGPMIGISVEALLVELVLLPRPRSRLLAMLAGASAALWASTQGLLTQVLLYGAELLELYLGVLRRLAELLGVHTDYAYLSMLGLTLVLALPGVVGGLWGHRLGRRVIARLEQGQFPVSMAEQLPHQGLAGDERVVRHRLLLAPIVMLALGLQFGRSLGLAVAALLLLLTALGLWARPALRALWLPRFWLFSLLLSLAAAVLLAPAREGGWLIGL